MKRSSSATPTPPSADPVHTSFLALLPRIELHGQVVFRGLKCADSQEDAIAEMVALAWLWFVRLLRQGKDPMEFPSAVATFAARQVRSGRRLCGQQKPKDVLSPRAQRRGCFSVQGLPDRSTRNGSPLEEALQDNTQTPVPEQVSFRMDFPAWLCSRTDRDRRVIEDLMLGERTLDVANKHGLSAGRISQLRRDFMQDWQRFCEPDPDSEPPATTGQ